MKLKLLGVNPQTNTKWLNQYRFHLEDRKGKGLDYFVSSRNSIENLKALKKREDKDNPDAVIINAVYKDKLVLIRQYRVPLNDYIYEFPAGLIDKGETVDEAGIRELKEETGLDLVEIENPFCKNDKGFFNSVGMTDECSSTIYGYASGNISKDKQEEMEDIEIVLVDRKEAKRILREELVSANCSKDLMYFIASEKGHEFDFLKECE